MRVGKQVGQKDCHQEVDTIEIDPQVIASRKQIALNFAREHSL